MEHSISRLRMTDLASLYYRKSKLRVCIIGAGRLGQSMASHMVSSYFPISQISIYDKNTSLMKGVCEDLRDMNAMLHRQIDIKEYVKPSDLYVITAGIPRERGERKFNFRKNVKIVHECVLMCDPDKYIIIATNPVDEITKTISSIMGGGNVYGLGDVLDHSRKQRTGKDPEKTANFIIDNKGFSSAGPTAEIMLLIGEICDDFEKRWTKRRNDEDPKKEDSNKG